MQQVLVHNLSRSKVKPVLVRYCASFLCRLRGLTFRRSITPYEGLLLVQKRESRVDSAITMLGVLTDLAIVWINSDKEVVEVRLARRWRLAYIPRRPARYVLEMALERVNDFQVGDKVKLEEVWID